MKKQWMIRLCLLLLLPIIGSVQAQDDSRFNVIATTTIIADMAQNVGGEFVNVTSLVPPDSDVHAFQITPADALRVEEADMLLINGAGLEEFLGDLLANAANTEPVVVGAGVPMLPFSDDMGHGHDDDHADEAHADDHADEAHDDDHADESHDDEAHDDDHADEAHADDHADEAHDDETIGLLGDGACEADDDHADEAHDDDHADEAHDDHAHGSCDPHYWTTPDNARLMVNNIAEAFAAADPTNADSYRANAAAYLAELDDTADLIQEILNDVPDERRVLVTNHEFLGYFAHEYEFELVGVVIPGGATLAEPGPRNLIDLADTLRDENINVIFAEVSQSQDLAQAVAAEVGETVQIVTLYSGSLSEPDGPAGTYLDYLLYNAQQITDALAN